MSEAKTRFISQLPSKLRSFCFRTRARPRQATSPDETERGEDEALEGSGTVATRNPTVRSPESGLKPFPAEDCKLSALLANEPPRKPRNDPLIKASFHSHTLPPWSAVP